MVFLVRELAGFARKLADFGARIRGTDTHAGCKGIAPARLMRKPSRFAHEPGRFVRGPARFVRGLVRFVREPSRFAHEPGRSGVSPGGAEIRAGRPETKPPRLIPFNHNPLSSATPRPTPIVAAQTGAKPR
jgi:hypothetical protein